MVNNHPIVPLIWSTLWADDQWSCYLNIQVSDQVNGSRTTSMVSVSVHLFLLVQVLINSNTLQIIIIMKTHCRLLCRTSCTFLREQRRTISSASLAWPQVKDTAIRVLIMIIHINSVEIKAPSCIEFVLLQTSLIWPLPASPSTSSSTSPKGFF